MNQIRGQKQYKKRYRIVIKTFVNGKYYTNPKQIICVYHIGNLDTYYEKRMRLRIIKK